MRASMRNCRSSKANPTLNTGSTIRLPKPKKPSAKSVPSSTNTSAVKPEPFTPNAKTGSAVQLLGLLAAIGRLGNRNIRAAPRHRRFPNQPQQEGHPRQTSGPGRDLQYKDGRTPPD